MTPSPRSRHVVIAPDSFKGSVTAPVAARALAAGWSAVHRSDRLTLLPMADGGEGTASVIASTVPAAREHRTSVSGPDGHPVLASWWLLPDGTAVLDLAAASGLPLMGTPDPLHASTFGAGQLVGAALDAGARRVVLALGGSATTDGGTGMLTALGARFLDAAGDPLAPGGGALDGVDRVDLSALRDPPRDGLLCLADVTSPLLGSLGAAARFGPQKGAGPAEVRTLERGLARLVGFLRGDPAQPGAGAAGGTAYGLVSVWGGEIAPGAGHVGGAIGLPPAIEAADVVLTGEGRYDDQSAAGKVVGYVTDLARRRQSGPPDLVGIVAGDLLIRPEPPIVALSMTELAGTADACLADPRRWLRSAAGRLAQSMGP